MLGTRNPLALADFSKKELSIFWPAAVKKSLKVSDVCSLKGMQFPCTVGVWPFMMFRVQGIGLITNGHGMPCR